MKASDVMTPYVVSVGPNNTVGEVANLLLMRGISGVPVVEGEQLVGIASEGDLIRRTEIGTAERHRSWWLRLLTNEEGAYAQQREELARVERQIRSIIEAIKEGIRTPGMKDELLSLEARKSEPAAEVKQAPAPAPRLHPRFADMYPERVERLQQTLNDEGGRGGAAEALRSLIDEIRLVPENGALAIELAGNLAGILALSSGSKKPATAGRDGLQTTLVAGARNRLCRTKLA